MKIDTGFLRELGARFMLIASVALLAGCGGGGSGADPQDYTPVAVAIQPGFDASDADPRGMRFEFDQDIAPSISKAAGKAADRDPADYIEVTDAEGEALSTTRRWLDSRTLMLFAQVSYGATYAVTFKAGFPVSLNEGIAEEQSFSVTFGKNRLDANSDFLADPIFMNPREDMGGMANRGNYFPLSGAKMASLLGDPVDMLFANLSADMFFDTRAFVRGAVDSTMSGGAVNIGDIDSDGIAEFAYYVREMLGGGYISIVGSLNGVFSEEARITVDGEPRRVGDVTGDGIDDMLIVTNPEEGFLGYVFAGAVDFGGVKKGADSFAQLMIPDEIIALSVEHGPAWSGKVVVEGVGNVNGDVAEIEVAGVVRQVPVNDIAASVFFYLNEETAPGSGVWEIAYPFESPAGFVAIYLGSSADYVPPAAGISKAPILPTPTTALSYASYLIESPAGEERLFGFSLAGGDIDGDGVAELIVGAPGVNADTAGSAYMYGDADFDSPRAIFTMDAGESASLAKAHPLPLNFDGPDKGFATGVAIADVISAGPREVIISSPLHNVVYVFSDSLVKNGEASLVGQVAASDASAVVSLNTQRLYTSKAPVAEQIQGEMALLGFSMRPVGDINNDGLEELSMHGKQLEVTYEQVTVGARCTWSVGAVSTEAVECTEGLALNTRDNGWEDALCDARNNDGDALETPISSVAAQSGLLYCTAERASYLKSAEMVTLDNCCEEEKVDSTVRELLGPGQAGFGFSALLYGADRLDGKRLEFMDYDLGSVLRNLSAGQSTEELIRFIATDVWSPLVVE